MSPDPIEVLRRRLLRFRCTEDADTVIDPAALAEADEVEAAISGLRRRDSPERIFDGVVVMANLYHFRGRLLGERSSEGDRRFAFGLFSIVHEVLPDTVPEALGNIYAPPRRGALPLDAVVDSKNEEACKLLEIVRSEGTVALAEQAIYGLRGLVELTDRHSDMQAMVMANLARALLLRFELGAPKSVLDEFLMVSRAVVARTPRGDSSWLGRASDLGVALIRAYELTGEGALLRQAIAVFREAVDDAAADGPDLAVCLVHFSDALNLAFDLEGRAEHLESAIEVGRRAVEATAGRRDDYALALSNLGNALGKRADRFDDAESLVEAISLQRRAAEITPEGHARRPLYLANLGSDLQRKYFRSGDLATLEEALSALRAAVAATPAGHHQRPQRLSSLGTALRIKHDSVGATGALDEAIEILGAAVETTRPDDVYRHSRLRAYGAALLGRSQSATDPDDLDRAIEIFRTATTIGTDDSGAKIGISQLANALRERYRKTGDGSDLEEAISLHRQAVETEDAHGVMAGFHWSSLAEALVDEYRATGDPTTLDEAIGAYRTALDNSPGERVERATHLYDLGRLLWTRARVTGDRATAAAALGSLRDAVAVETAPAWTRVLAAELWGQAAARAGHLSEALDGYAAAVELIDTLVWRGLGRADQERQLARVAGLARNAAAFAIACGRPERAVELLEHGRGVLLARTLDARTAYDDLRLHLPELADELADVLDALQHGSFAPGASEDVADRDDGRSKLAVRRDELLAQIRRSNGFQDFMRPARFESFLPAASGGPVIVVNTSDYRSDALIVTALGVRAVPLPKLTETKADAEVTRFTKAINALHSSSATLTAVLAARGTITDVLGWLWDAIAAPVLDALGDHHDGGRVWWCPTGLLTLLPLHAAARGTAPGVLDRVISSYTPTLRALIHARQRTAEPAPNRLLTVCVSVTPDHPELPGAAAEVAAIAAHTETTQLADGNANVPTVLEQLGRHSWAHFACHGVQDLDNPSRGRLVLHDRPLMIREITTMHLRSAEFAFMSACDTARAGTHLADEAITVVGAMQLAGYRHVVGTLWSIQDAVATKAATRLYKGMPRPGQPAAAAAAALHDTVRSLRELFPSQPALWAAYVHLGP
ncbi:CHAT domain-containing protein [Amycolatopsis sp. NPDC003731]